MSGYNCLHVRISLLARRFGRTYFRAVRSAFRLLFFSGLLGLLFGSERRMDMLLPNVRFFPNYTVSQLQALVVGFIMWVILLAEVGLDFI